MANKNISKKVKGKLYSEFRDKLKKNISKKIDKQVHQSSEEITDQVMNLASEKLLELRINYKQKIQKIISYSAGSFAILLLLLFFSVKRIENKSNEKFTNAIEKQRAQLNNYAILLNDRLDSLTISYVTSVDTIIQNEMNSDEFVAFTKGEIRDETRELGNDIIIPMSQAYFEKAMQKIEKTAAFKIDSLSNEINRLQRLIDSGNSTANLE